MIFKVPRGFWGSENPKKLIKVGSERLRGAKNDAKRGLGRLPERKLSQHGGPKGRQKGHDCHWRTVKCCNFWGLGPPKGSKILIILDLRSKKAKMLRRLRVWHVNFGIGGTMIHPRSPQLEGFHPWDSSLDLQGPSFERIPMDPVRKRRRGNMYRDEWLTITHLPGDF